jgi:glycosyltransferase involved in cell wall biosynthesis
MRIRYVLFNAFASGGTTRTVVNQANALCQAHEVEVASVYRHRRTPRFEIDSRVRLVPLTERRSDGSRRGDPEGSWRLPMRLARRFSNPMPHRLDGRFPRWHPPVDLRLLRYLWASASEGGILVTTRPGTNLLAARLAPRRQVLVAQDHMHLDSYQPELREAIVRAYRRFDAVVTLTETDRAAYREALAGAPTRVECIPNGVPQPRLPPASLDAKVIVAAGRLAHQKGFDLLLDAFQIVAGTHPDWQLWIFGGGARREALAAQIDRLGLAGRAHLKGTAAHLDERLAAAAIYVLSSRFEGLPMVLLEAMSAGLPPVAFDCPTGPAQIITHGKSGLLVPAQDVPALAAGICQLIEDPAKRKAMSTAARADSARYSIDAVARRWEALFSDLLVARMARRASSTNASAYRSRGISPR